MTNIKNIFLLTILLSVINVAVFWIFKILNYISAEDFSNSIKDSLSIVGVLFLVAIVVSLILNTNKK